MTDVPREIDALAKIAVDCGFKLHMAFGPGLLESAEYQVAFKLNQGKPLPFRGGEEPRSGGGVGAVGQAPSSPDSPQPQPLP